MSKPTITLSVQSGDVESSEATRPVFIRLRQELADHCTGSYSPDISEFAIVLRIAGSIWRFEGEGLQKLRINREGSYITVDIVIPEQRWRDVPTDEIERYFGSCVEQAVKLMVEKLQKLKVPVAATRLQSDLRTALAAFATSAPLS